MKTSFAAAIIAASLGLHPTHAQANEGVCAAERQPFRGYWGGSRILVHQQVAGIPFLFMIRFSYREIRHAQCLGGASLFPLGVGEADFSIGLPIVNNRRGGWMLAMGAQGQGSQRPGEPVSGIVTGAPSTSGHVNLWGAVIPLVQFTDAITTAILPDAEFPMSVAYVGGMRLYPLYRKHIQTNLGMTIGGSNSALNIIPSFALRASDFVLMNRRIAIGAEVRLPMSLNSGPLPYEWRIWGALTLSIDEIDRGKVVQVLAKSNMQPRSDLVRSPPHDAPPTQTAWETPL
jgi:hypothetical protein